MRRGAVAFTSLVMVLCVTFGYVRNLRTDAAEMVEYLHGVAEGHKAEIKESQVTCSTLASSPFA